MWNLFKWELTSAYSQPSSSQSGLNRLSKVVKASDNLYGRHFDVSTAGGRLIKRRILSKGFEVYLKAIAKANRYNVNLPSFLLSNQLKTYFIPYWLGRIIDGPAGTVYTIFPGIWTNIFFNPNIVPAAMSWTDSLALTLYVQKMSVIGIRISKPFPFITPWSGFLFKTFDAPGGIGSITGPMKNAFGQSMDQLTAYATGDISVGNQVKSQFNSIVDQVYSPQLFSSLSDISSPYGIDYNNPPSLPFSSIESRVSQTINDTANKSTSIILNSL